MVIKLINKNSMDCTTIEFFNSKNLEKYWNIFNLVLFFIIVYDIVNILRGEIYVSKNHELWLLGY